MLSPGLQKVLAQRHPTPYLALDPDVVRERHRLLRTAFGGATILYAVKACPEPAVLRALVADGAGFDVASQQEIALCLAAGADPATLQHGNPVRGPGAAARAAADGIRRFVTDSAEDVDALAAEVPGARVQVRLIVDDSGSATPFHGKFGALPGEAVGLLHRIRERGLVAAGVTFHAGSQQVRPQTYADAVGTALAVAGRAGLRRPELDLGGGWPVAYRSAVPGPEVFAAAVREAVDAAVTAGRVDDVTLFLEPGRALAAPAGVLRATVLRVSRRPGVDHRRWVYLDVGRYQGLAETEGEAVGYPIRVPDRSGPPGPAVLAGPTCDGDDVIYRRTPVALPLDLAAGDVLDLLGTGAYTSSYASVGFNGFGPLRVVVADRP
ncbi:MULTISPECIES: type III PLP-dependent enzyme [Pseudonocardia]|uniref:ornithine decarboxylase n=2 Tax=Pseudonocardia TaxID=1847 RepID=A0A1Y2N2Q2_PSEAH|nr:MULTISPECIES: type III PLP-dependent enzyme [Pseudonocardia]OSY41471.1 Lysine/ornithine decarboxylase [Pseudonocardia autotrophica]TDN71428.1 ornithine decarboxylase [Pseudonocardia autotrophica]BBG02103.1 ornithine decarboxylase [Pseudonocardia autotrophica]GEC24117.1 ornithine decarboxylase [Pseudonocardia saturnea]